MNKRKSNPSTTKTSDREQIQQQLADRIDFIDDRIAAVLADDDVDEEVLIRWVRAQGYLAGQYRKLMKDTDIDEMQEELSLLKEVHDLEGER